MCCGGGGGAQFITHLRTTFIESVQNCDSGENFGMGTDPGT